MAKRGISKVAKIHIKIMQFSRKRKVGKFSADKNINARTFSDNKISNSIYFKLTILHFLGDYEIGM